MFWYLSPKDKCAVCVWSVGCLGRTADWQNREQSAVPIRQSSQIGKADFPILLIWFMFSILQKSLHSSPFLPNPLCLSAFREVKSHQQLFTTLHLDSKSIGRCVSSFMRWCVEVYGWRVVKSGWRAAANSSPPQSPCLSVFRRVWWRVKSISVFASALLHIISRNMCQFNDEKSFN